MAGKQIIFSILTAILLTFSINAQSNIIKGRVEDSANKPIAGAIVVLKNQKTGLERIVTTDGEGRFVFNGLGTGEFVLTAKANGFARTSKNVTDSNAETIFTLEIETLREEVTVQSASRQEELRESLTTKVDVITERQMRDTGNETVGEILREVPGVLTRRGSETAGVAGEQVQGISSRQVLVLLDGQPVVGARGIKSGNLNLDRQSVARLDSVEVVKGSSSALFGSDAIGGVINMISREPRKPFEAGFSASAGNFGIADFRGNTGFKRDKLSGFFSAERHKNNGFDLTPTTFDTTGAGFHRYDFYGKLKYQFNDRFSLIGFGNSYWNNAVGRSVGEEGNQTNNVDESSQNYGLTADLSLTSKAALQLRGYFARFDEISSNRVLATNAVFPGNLFERYGKLDATFSWLIGERNFLQVGGEWTTDRYRGINRLRNDAGERVDTKNFWIQDKINITNRLTLTVGGRIDDNSIFGSAVTPKVGLNYRVNENASLRASWGRGYRAPDLGHLYFRFLNPTNFYQVIGNPNLSPEHSGSWQIGGEFNALKRKVRFGVNYFRNDVRNLIEAQSLGFIATPTQLNAVAIANGIDLAGFRPALGRLLFFYKNLQNVYTQGLEFDTEILLPQNFALSGAYTYLDARDKTTDLYLTSRHPHQGFIKLSWDRPKLGFRGNIRGTFYSDWVNARTTAGVETVGRKFALWDIYAAKSITKGFEIYGAVDNFWNDQDPRTNQLQPNGTPYPILRPEAGRTFRIGIRWELGKEK